MTVLRLGDILANSITHGIGASLAVCGAAYLIIASVQGTPGSLLGAPFMPRHGSDLLVLTLYHSMVRTRAHLVLRVLEHSAIYLLIVGADTPFYPGLDAGASGMDPVWHCVDAGHPIRQKKTNGWGTELIQIHTVRGLVAIGPLARAITWRGMASASAGGVVYTLGILFFAYAIPQRARVWWER